MEKLIPYKESSFIFSPLCNILYFPVWWYYDVSFWFFGLAKRSIQYLEDRIAIVLTFRLLFRPIFQDYTLAGRILGPLFRSLRIFAGLYIITNAALFISLLLILWLSIPILYLLALHNIPQSWAFLPLTIPFMAGVFVLYYRNYALKPKQKIGAAKIRNLNSVIPQSVQKFLPLKLNAFPLLETLLKTKKIEYLIRKLGLDQKSLNKFLERELRDLSFEREEFLNIAYTEAVETKSSYLDLEHLFLALVEECEPLFENFRRLGIDIEILKGAVNWLEEEKEYYHPKTLLNPDYVVRTKGGVNRSWNARPTPILDRHSRDLTKLAQEGKIGPIIGKDTAISEIIWVLSRKTKHNPLLIGEPGSGKTSVILGLAKAIIAGGQAKALWDKRLVSLDIASLTAGTRSRGEINEMVTTIVKEIEASGNVILFIDEIHNLVSTAEEPDIATILGALMPHLEEEKFKLIGVTSFPQYRRYIEPNEAFSRLFEIVEIEEATEEETTEILKYISFSLENEYKITISYPALIAAIEISKKYIHERVLPDKAVDLLDSTAVKVSQKKGPGGLVLKDDIEETASEKIHIPLGTLTEEATEKLLKLEELLHRRVVDQNEAIKTISDTLRRARTGIREEKRPMGSLLFVGPTGVGKTEMAKAVAETFFGSEENMIRLDMSEYQEMDSLNRLIGAPPGKGPGEGQLTEAARRRPFSLILLDEVEKAHSNILDIFLQVFDDGRLTDARGHTIDFTNTIIIATSNAGANLILQAIQTGQTMEEIKDELMIVLTQKFKPELLNRFDGIIFCRALSQKEAEETARRLMERVRKRLEDKDIHLEYTRGLIEELANRGYTPELGARPIRRLIQDKIEAHLAKKILSNEIKKGDLIRLSELPLG